MQITEENSEDFCKRCADQSLTVSRWKAFDKVWEVLGCSDGIFRIRSDEEELPIDRLVKQKGMKFVEREVSSSLLEKICLVGTEFQRSVWKVLLEISHGDVLSYAKVAQRINREKAVRAVGSAIGKNPLPLLVPCHRVIRSNQEIGGFRYGTALKEQILLQERSQDKALFPSLDRQMVYR